MRRAKIMEEQMKVRPAINEYTQQRKEMQARMKEAKEREKRGGAKEVVTYLYIELIPPAIL